MEDAPTQPPRSSGALKSAGVEFTNGGQPGVKMRQIDMESIERTRWPQWVEADTAEVAIAAIRKIWPQTTVVDDGRQHIVYLGLNQEIRAAEVDYLGNNRWRFRVKKPRYIAAKFVGVKFVAGNGGGRVVRLRKSPHGA